MYSCAEIFREKFLVSYQHILSNSYRVEPHSTQLLAQVHRQPQPVSPTQRGAGTPKPSPHLDNEMSPVERSNRNPSSKKPETSNAA